MEKNTGTEKTWVQAVLEHAQRKPDALAVGWKENRMTYRELARQVKAAAVILAEEYGIKQGDKVMISAVSRPDYPVASLAVQYLLAVPIPVDKAALEKNIIAVYRFAEPKLLLADTKITEEGICRRSLLQFYKKVQQYGEEPELPYHAPDFSEIAEILFTTGTTGTPKGVMLTYKNIHAITDNTWQGTGMEETDRVLLPLPLNHSVGMRVLRTILTMGASVILQNGFAFPKEIYANMEAYQCTGFVCVPASIELLYRQMADRFAPTFRQFRYIEIGAGSLSYHMKKELVRLLPDTDIVNTWGSTETGGVIFLHVSENPDKLESLGRPVGSVKLKTVDSEGKEVHAEDSDSAGRMALSGPNQMAGYYHLQEEETLDGYLLTNDLVYMDKDGYVYMVGRADDIINAGGKKVSPNEVENAASEFEGIRECACIGIEDEVLGQAPALFIVLEQGKGVDEAALTRFLGGRLEAYKLPKKFLYLPELPRNRMKKLDRKELRRIWEENGDQELMNETMSVILSRHSVRKFTERQIPKAVLAMILKAGIQAPSGHNLQTWNFTVIRRKDEIEKLKNRIKTVTAEKNVFFYGMENPDTLILVSNDRRNENGIQDSSCAAENIMLAAQSYGIGSVWINALKTICDEPDIREKLKSYGISDKHIVWACICLGYAEGEPKIVARKNNVVHWVE